MKQAIRNYASFIQFNWSWARGREAHRIFKFKTWFATGQTNALFFLLKIADRSVVCLYLSVLQVLHLVLVVLLWQLLQRFGDLKSVQGAGLTKLLQVQRDAFCLLTYFFDATWSLWHCVFVLDWPFWGTASTCSSGSTVLRGMLTSSSLEVKSTE